MATRLTTTEANQLFSEIELRLQKLVMATIDNAYLQDVKLVKRFQEESFYQFKQHILHRLKKGERDEAKQQGT